LFIALLLTLYRYDKTLPETLKSELSGDFRKACLTWVTTCDGAFKPAAAVAATLTNLPDTGAERKPSATVVSDAPDFTIHHLPGPPLAVLPIVTPPIPVKAVEEPLAQADVAGNVSDGDEASSASEDEGLSEEQKHLAKMRRAAVRSGNPEKARACTQQLKIGKMQIKMSGKVKMSHGG
jgi:hypothetical protein